MAFWGVLGTSWRRLVGFLGASWESWGRLGSQNPPQDAPKSKPRRSKTVLKLKVVFRSLFWEQHREFLEPTFRILGRLRRQVEAKLGPSWRPNREKIDPEINQNFEVISRSIFGVAPEFLRPKLSDFGPSWAPCWSQVGAKLAPKSEKSRF